MCLQKFRMKPYVRGPSLDIRPQGLFSCSLQPYASMIVNTAGGFVHSPIDTTRGMKLTFFTAFVVNLAHKLHQHHGACVK